MKNELKNIQTFEQLVNQFDKYKLLNEDDDEDNWQEGDEPEYLEIRNIGDLKRAIQNLSDDMYVGVSTNGGDGLTSYQVCISGVGDFPGGKMLLFLLD